MVAEWIVVGFFSAIGWWSANYFVIAPYLPEPTKKEIKIEEQKKPIEEKKND
jgi:hypothetical protein